MPGSPPRYTSHFSGEAVAAIVQLSRRKQFKVLDLADRIAARPTMIGDYSSTDAAGREIQNILIEEFLFSFWVDEAARQVRITEVVEA